MNKRNFFATLGMAVALAACSTTNPNTPGSDSMSKRSSIDANVSGAMTKLYAQDPGSRELVRKARGVLVFPSVLSAGFVVGGSYGTGALLEGNRTVGYYSTTAGSVGLLAGADSKAVYVLFMTQDALDKVRSEQGLDGGRRCVGLGPEGRCEHRCRHADGAAAGDRLRADQRRSDGQPQHRRHQGAEARPLIVVGPAGRLD